MISTEWIAPYNLQLLHFIFSKIAKANFGKLRCNSQALLSFAMTQKPDRRTFIPEYTYAFTMLKT